MAVDEPEFGLQHLQTLLGVDEPATGDAAAEAGEQGRGTLLRPDEAKAASTATPIPTSAGTARPERGARASRIPKPMQAKAIWARNSAVTSTTVDAVAVCHSMP